MPLNTRLKGLEAAEILSRVRPRILFSTSTLLGHDHLVMLRETCGEPAGDRPFSGLPDLEAVVAYGDGPGREACTTHDAFLARGASVPAGAVAAREAALGPGSPAEILFTSGTTGTPKGVVLGHQQLLHTYWDWSGVVDLGPDDVFLLTGSYSHGPGINGQLVTSLMRHFSSVVLAVFDSTTALDTIRDERVTVMIGPGNLFARLLAANAGQPAPHLRVIFLGMATVPAELTSRLAAEWGVEILCNAYGLIEGSVVCIDAP